MTGGVTPFGQASDTQPRVLFFAHDSRGAGHVRRTLALSAELAYHRPDVAMVLVTSSFLGEAWRVPDNLDVIKLPSLARRDLYRDDQGSGLAPARDRRGPHKTFAVLRERVIFDIATTFDPWLFVVDNEPLGMRSSTELMRTLRVLRPRSTRSILGLRDIYDDPELVRVLWNNRGVIRVLEELYDRVLVYGDPSVFDVAAEYDLPPSVVAKLHYTGYIRKHEALAPAAGLRASLCAEEQPLVVVTTGSGVDGAPYIRAYLTALARGLLPSVASFIVTGPLMPESESAALLDAVHPPATRVVPFAPDLTSWINAADLVISMAGYNTVTEALGYGKRMVVVPRVEPAEQRIRAERLAGRGLLRMVHPRDLTPEELARQVQAALASPPPDVRLDFGGLGRAGNLLAAALG